MEFLLLSRRRSSVQNVHSGEERGETDVFAGYQSMCVNSFENKLYIIIIITVVQAIDHYCNQHNINLKVCPEMHANEIHALHD